MTGWNLPPGCTDRMVDEAFGYSEGRRGVYKVTVTRTMEMTTVVEVEASSRDDAIDDAAIATKDIPVHKWTISQDDFDVIDVEGPPERDPDDERDARADYEYDRNR
jgi:hypothetical protein